MTFKLGTKSEEKLGTVDARIGKVLRLAITRSTVDFGVIQGKRTGAEQDELYTHGRTTAEIRKAGIMNMEGKPHLPKVTWTRQSDHESGEAIDVGAYLNGKYQPGNTSAERALYVEIAGFIKAAAAELGIPLKWGPDIGLKTDLGHYQI